MVTGPCATAGRASIVRYTSSVTLESMAGYSDRIGPRPELADRGRSVAWLSTTTSASVAELAGVRTWVTPSNVRRWPSKVADDPGRRATSPR